MQTIISLAITLLLSFLSFVLVIPQAHAINTSAKQAVVMDYDTGTVLFSYNADELMAPSSMSKLMTAYLMFDRLKEGTITLDDTFYVSEKAWRKQGSKMFVPVGKQVKVEDLLHGIITQSGNDACIVAAEGIAGSEEAFAELMTLKAKELGMHNTTFKNSTGWPHPEHQMTARDLAILSKRIIQDFPEYYHFFSEDSFTYSGIKQPNRNILLYRDIGVDGLKTGHTEAGGYGIAISGTKGDRRLVVVVNGLESEKGRADEAQKLFNYGLLNFKEKTLFKANEPIETAEVAYGKEKNVQLAPAQELTILVPTSQENNITAAISYEGPIVAPITKGQEIGTLTISIPEMEDKTIPIVAIEEVKRASYFARLIETAKHRLSGI